MKTLLPQSRLSLEKLSDELEKVLDVIYKRETNINSTMGSINQWYKKQNQDTLYYTNKY